MRARLGDESGVALVVVAGVVMVLGILSAVVATASVNFNNQSIEGRSSKRALAAAEAGIRRAIYRTNQLGPTSNQCVGDAAPTTPPTGSIFCKGHGYLGNGVAYDFWISQVLDGSAGRESTGGCIGVNQRIEPTTSSSIKIDQRCVVAVGCVEPTVTDPTVPCVDSSGNFRGVTRRLEVRAGAQTVARVFPGGLYGNQRLCIGANVAYTYDATDGGGITCNELGGGANTRVDSDIGADISVLLTGGGNPVPLCWSRTPGSTEPARGAQVLLGTGASLLVNPNLNVNKCTDPTSESFNLNPTRVDIPPFGQDPPIEPTFQGCFLDDTCTPSDSTDTAVVNNNGALPGALRLADGVTPAACAKYYATNGTDRELDLRDCSGVVLIPPGKYNFCRLFTNDGFGPTSAATPPVNLDDVFDLSLGGNPVYIFLDSPYRAGSGCGKGSQLGHTAGNPRGLSDTLGRQGNNWDFPGTGSPPANCSNTPGHVNTTGYRCADGSILFSNNTAITGGAADESLRFQFYVFGHPRRGANCRPYPAAYPSGQTSITPTGSGSNYSLPCPPPTHPIEFSNNTPMTYTMYAPNSTVHVRNAGGGQIEVRGGIRAENIVIRNGIRFVQDVSTRRTTASITGRRYFRGPFIECQRSFPGGDPRGGCSR